MRLGRFGMWVGGYAYIRLCGYAVRQIGNRQKFEASRVTAHPLGRKKNRFRLGPAVVIWWYYPNSTII
jgi:hypothetical protein